MKTATQIYKWEGKLNGPAMLRLTSENIEPFTITLSNDAGERVVVGYDKGANNYFIDRSNSGKVSFEKGFSGIHTAPRLREGGNFDLILIIDEASVELFARSRIICNRREEKSLEEFEDSNSNL